MENIPSGISGFGSLLLLFTTVDVSAQPDGSSDTTTATSYSQVASSDSGTSSMGDKIQWELMGSAAYLLDGHTTSDVYSGSLGYPYTNSHGFLGNFFGGNVSYGGDNWGAQLDLRWGTAAPLLTPLAPIKQGYVTWMPNSSISFDLGFMDTIFGAEVADEWANVNFSRGALYFLRQPFNHMGLRVSTAVNETVALKFLVTNGPTGALGLGGAPVDSDQVPSVAAQVAMSPDDTTSVALGYMTGPNGSDANTNFGHFFDVVVTKSVGDLSLVLNGDLTIDPHVAADTVVLFGGSVAASAPLNSQFSAGGRIEFLDGSGGGPGAGNDDYIMTMTGTLRHMASENLVISLEPRIEFAGADVYVKDNNELDKFWFGFMVGASSHFGN